jgi:hypothetical protein
MKIAFTTLSKMPIQARSFKNFFAAKNMRVELLEMELRTGHHA